MQGSRSLSLSYCDVVTKSRPSKLNVTNTELFIYQPPVSLGRYSELPEAKMFKLIIVENSLFAKHLHIKPATSAPGSP